MNLNSENEYIINDGIYYRGILDEIKKSTNPLQPIFEAFTNSFESIKLGIEKNILKSEESIIKIKLYYETKNNLEGNAIFSKMEIEDNGIGFDEENFLRFNTYKDTRKGFKNKGSGRIQFIQFFDSINCESVFYSKEKTLKKRNFSLSAKYCSETSSNYKNAIVYVRNISEVDIKERKTVFTMENLLDEKDKLCYNKLSVEDLKNKIILHYILDFCLHRDNLPIIQIIKLEDGLVIDELEISKNEIPQIDKKEEVEIEVYSNINGELIKNKTEILTINAFKIEKNLLSKNEIKFVSKNEVVDRFHVELKNIKTSDDIEGKRYFFLVSGSYIDSKDGDTRGNLNFYKKEDILKQNCLFPVEELILEDVEEKINSVIYSMYKEITEKVEKHKQEIKQLKDTFLLSDEIFNSLNSINLNDTEEKILEKVYIAETKNIAKKDSEIKIKIDSLNQMDPTDENYDIKLNSIVSDLVTTIPLQNRTALTHYVARRKMILELFKKILSRDLDIQKSGKRNVDEKLLHNLLFKQSSIHANQSDLWILDEDFLYFSGCSEKQIKDIQYNAEKIIKEDLTVEEELYITSLKENRLLKRPDILLFPNEGKCIIIELKTPGVNLGEHLSEIQRYASIINNLSNEKFKINTFYGYLIGEGTSDIRDFDSDFIEAAHFNCFVRKHKIIAGKFGRIDGSIYTEALNYSTLLERAQKRNEAFIEKLKIN